METMKTYKAKINRVKGTIRIISKGERSGYLLEDFGHYNPGNREFLLNQSILSWHLREDSKVDGRMVEIVN